MTAALPFTSIYSVYLPPIRDPATNVFRVMAFHQGDAFSARQSIWSDGIRGCWVEQSSNFAESLELARWLAKLECPRKEAA